MGHQASRVILCHMFTLTKIQDPNKFFRTLQYAITNIFPFPERRVLREQDYPLLERVLLGPLENEAKIFIMEKAATHEVSVEVIIIISVIDAT